MSQKALAMILTDKVANDQFIVVDDFGISKAKTKDLAGVIEKLPVKSRKVMILLSNDEKDLKKASDNLDTAKTYKADSINAQAAITCPSIVIFRKRSTRIYCIT